METIGGEKPESREDAAKRRKAEFAKYMEAGQRKDKERLSAIMAEHGQKVDAAQAARDKERQEVELEMGKNRERLSELGKISKKLDNI